jgi:hypothetical protein
LRDFMVCINRSVSGILSARTQRIFDKS